MFLKFCEEDPIVLYIELDLCEIYHEGLCVILIILTQVCVLVCVQCTLYTCIICVICVNFLKDLYYNYP